jgi:hypothetical protein
MEYIRVKVSSNNNTLRDKTKSEIKRKASKGFIYISNLAEYASYRFSHSIPYNSMSINEFVACTYFGLSVCAQLLIASELEVRKQLSDGVSYNAFTNLVILSKLTSKPNRLSSLFIFRYMLSNSRICFTIFNLFFIFSLTIRYTSS